jgi:predicted NAD/FAD-binding protein
MTFKSTGFTVHDGLLELPGKLTIRSITHDVAMEVEFLGLDETELQGEQRIGISATTTIRRSDYGVGAGAGEGQKIVFDDKITILAGHPGQARILTLTARSLATATAFPVTNRRSAVLSHALFGRRGR